MIEIEFVLEDEPDRLWLTQLLFAAVAHGVRFNAGGFSGTYRILPDDPEDEIVRTVTDDIERTGLLAEAIEHYTEFTPKNTDLYLMTTDTATQPALPVWLSLKPHEDRFLLSIGTNRSDIESGEQFTSFLSLPKAIFERLSFLYGGSRVDEQRHVPVTQADAKTDDLRLVTFYPPELVSSIGRERLLSAPAATATTLADGSVFLLVSTELHGNRDKREAIRDHIFG